MGVEYLLLTNETLINHKSCFGFALGSFSNPFMLKPQPDNTNQLGGFFNLTWEINNSIEILSLILGGFKDSLAVSVMLQPFQGFSRHLIVCKLGREINDCLVFLSIANGRKMSSAIHSNHRKWLTIICVGIMKITSRSKVNIRKVFAY